jgi:hypothetical protein
MPELPLVGDEFAGYRLRSVLGRGGMSAVYQAENPRLGNVIALKILAPELAADDVFRTRFLEESRIAAAMNHPHVIPIHDMGSSGGLLYIAMRCVAGTDLRQMIAKRGRLQPDVAVFLLTQAARALDAAHRRGLVHRDVKPGNLLIERGSEDGEPDHLYLADFGITKRAVSPSGLSSTGQFLGTVDYVAPEQIRGMAADGMADQYSLGCVLYECLTGRVPFEKDLDAAVIWAHVEEPPARPTTLRPDLPPAVDEVFARVLAKQPDDRYENCRDFMAEARDALGDVAVQRSAGGPLAGGPLRLADEFAGAAARPPRVLSAPAGYPAELTHETDQVTDVDWAAEDLAGADLAGAYVADADLAAEGPPPGGFDGFDGWPPRRQPRRRGPRARWLAITAAFVLLAAGVAAWTGLAHGSAPGSGHPRPLSASPMGPSTGSSMRSSMASSAPASPAAAQPASSALMRALALADESNPATGKLPPASCKQQGTTMATCLNPAPGIDEASFRIYPSLTALYAAYETLAKSLNSGHFQQNVQDCGLAAPSPVGEVAWNHEFKHPRIYSVQQMEMGMVPLAKAAGRVFCLFTGSGTEDIVWTQDNGNLLGVVSGGPHADVWYWWSAVHHSIALDGKPMQMPMPS